MKIFIEYLEDAGFEYSIKDMNFKNCGGYCQPQGIWPYGDILIIARKSIRDNNKIRLHLLLTHEYIHAINYILFGWNRILNKVLDYLNEVVWVFIREFFRVVCRILNSQRRYFKYYWCKR
jgi:hypothetical protein